VSATSGGQLKHDNDYDVEITDTGDDEWMCSRCTFTNENMCFIVCETCGEERP